jgi:predicted transposase/invertase (TIGR01784 family)
MSFDTTCRRLAEMFPEDFASWLLGRRVTLTELRPTELSLEAIRADRVILLQGETETLHIEFQTDPKDEVPMRMADYRLRLHRLSPEKTIRQVVIYLRKTNSPKVYQDYFEIPGLYAEFDIIRIWEVPAAELMAYEGLLPFVALSQTEDACESLRSAVHAINQMPDESQQHEAMAATYVLAGLKLDKAIISSIIRRDVMQESVTYQAIVQEGRDEGEGRKGREIALNLLREGLSIELIARSTGLSIEAIQQLQTELK